jgi:hypothetical protein
MGTPNNGSLLILYDGVLEDDSYQTLALLVLYFLSFAQRWPCAFLLVSGKFLATSGHYSTKDLHGEVYQEEGPASQDHTY